MALTLDARALLQPAQADAAALAQAQQAVEQAARALKAGALVGLPTETVYGLAADADQAGAVGRIFDAKGRPKNHPLIVHLAGASAAQWQAGVDHYARELPDFASKLMQAFWPGPLTLILPRKPGVGAASAGGQDSIGLRCPAHPVAQALLQACAAIGIHGIAAPSANRFGRVSPTSAEHVRDEFDALLSDDELLILDGGPCPVGIESTIVDCSRGRPVLLRPGMIGIEALEAAIGQPVALRDQAAPKASGTLESHYAPTARVRLMPLAEMQAALDLLGADASGIAIYTRQPVGSASRHLLLRYMPTRADACAQELFAVLRELDLPDTRLIWVETPPADAAWDGVRDRLQRAAA
ncbi:L-threonylcarbamoyladenylate synthase [Malikia sp.]|uniref:L-threonylcarbamoyladenylate synthase n=1 Tax=Malikia sp. TaxID=2070706 RepID=UPI002639CA71|nr:L-threonylcarbamoyladenylate synthase [Malikia sp.]MDD2729603.1 L-threonylcarbamoyladenylate synthase [Malikia sp.]